MAHWLFKSEAEVFSFARLVAEKRTEWSGVRNHSAKLNMMGMKLGERGFYYHSGDEKAVVGVVGVVGLYRPDPSDETGKFGMVDIAAMQPIPEPVTLEAVKADARLAKMALVVNSRLSVQPVTDAEWAVVSKMGGLAARPSKRSKS